MQAVLSDFVVFPQMRYFVCCECYAKVAHYNSIFAMSKQGIQSNFCNPCKSYSLSLTDYQ